MEKETQKPKSNPSKNRRTVFIVAGFTLFFGLYLLAFLVPDVLSTLSGPKNMSLDRAAEVASDESIYVSLEDGQWDCDTITHVRRRSPSSSGGTKTTTETEIFLTDGKTTPTIVVFTTLSGRWECDDLNESTSTGYLTVMSDDQQQELTNEVRLAKFFRADTALALCGYCGTENSLIGLIFGVVITLGGIGALILGLRMPKE
jgi:hypothetical protein